MRPIQSISVLMPTWQGMEFLERVLAALAGQELDLPWDLRIIDSGSTDGTWETLQAWRSRFPVPLELERIHQVEFDHGDTRNLLAARSRGDLIVFLTQDAIPGGPDWLATLAKNFDDEQVGGAYCRNVARPDAHDVTRVLCANDPGYITGRIESRLPEPEAYALLTPDEKRLLFNFQDVASAVRRELWERHPFPRANFGEDILMARALLEGGYTVVYDDVAVVEHSHDYDAAETYNRAWIDGRFNAQWLDRLCVRTAKDVVVLAKRTAEMDRQAAADLGLLNGGGADLLHEAATRRVASFHGLREGGVSETRHLPTRMLDTGKLRVLYVVHGFPPDTWAGTEIYTDNIAREIQRRGHHVAVFTRAPAAEGSGADFDLEETERDGLKVWRMLHRLDHQSLRDSFDQPRAEAAFARVLAAERPDIVHFQHLIHSSIGLVRIAKNAGCATMITCHDYWALCARVQMIRPDGVRCDHNMGSGCFACVKDKGLKTVGAMHAVDRAAGHLLPALAEAACETESVTGEWRARAAEYLDLRARETEVPAAYAACDLRVSPSRFLRDVYLESGHFDPHTFLFSDNGMRTDHLHALQKVPHPEGKLRFGFVGSLVWYKGGAVMVEAMRHLLDLDCELHIHGPFDPKTDAHHAELAKLAEGSDVTFHGRFDNARLSEVHAELDVLIVPSVWVENSPITIHEAFLTRTPIVASDIGGMAEFVHHERNGLVFRTGDAADLAKQLRRLVEEPELLTSLDDFPPVKTLVENGEETEFRYRGLVCRVRPDVGVSTLIEFAGNQDVLREGNVEPQDAHMLLLRPGGGAAEYEIGCLMPGPVTIEVDVQLMAGETDVEMSGRLLIDGIEASRITNVRAGQQDEIHVWSTDAVLPRDVRRLRIQVSLDNIDGADEGFVRISAVRVRTVPKDVLA